MTPLLETKDVEAGDNLFSIDEGAGLRSPNMLPPVAGALPKSVLAEELLTSCSVLASKSASVVCDTVEVVAKGTEAEPNLKLGKDGEVETPEAGRLEVMKLAAMLPLLVLAEAEKTEPVKLDLQGVP